MTRVVVTGATGFVGRVVCRALSARDVHVIGGTRTSRPVEGAVGFAELTPESTLETLCAGIAGADAVIHLAAAVHDMRGRTTTGDYLRVNRDYPLLLARAAVASKVRRFVFVSTIKVNGDGTKPGCAYSEASQVDPRGAYAESKWQAEQGLRELASSSELETLIVRPPLVYGPGVRANFRSLMRWVQRGVPLPFATLHNGRSLVYVENLADLLVELALAPAPRAGASTYLVSDGEDLSTPELVRAIARALGVAPRLFPVPEMLLRRAASALGRAEVAERLLGSLRVDSSLVRRDFGWAPPFSVAEGLQRTARWFEREA